MKWLSILLVLVSCSAFAELRRVVIDVRTPEEYKQEHVAGALNIEYQNINKEIVRVAPDKNAPIALYCRSGRRAGIALAQLKTLGYTHVENVGGLDEMKKRAAAH